MAFRDDSWIKTVSNIFVITSPPTPVKLGLRVNLGQDNYDYRNINENKKNKYYKKKQKCSCALTSQIK